MTRPRGDRVYDLVVIGGGTAGLVAAAGAASLGARTALLERDRLGGECLWTGCVPSKALIGSARLAATARRGDEFGLEIPPSEVDGGAVLESVRRVRSRIQPHDDPERFRRMGVDVAEGAAARFVSPRAVEAGGERIEGRRFLVATGSRPEIPPVEALDAAGYFTHETAFEEESLPGSLVVLGGGPIGVELAQAYARLGVKVALVEMRERILPGEDPELSGRLGALLEEEGVRIHTGQRAVAARRTARTRRVMLQATEAGERDDTGAGQRRDPDAWDAPGAPAAGLPTLAADRILVAAGRRPNVEGLGLEEVGVQVGRDGVLVDDKLRTARKHIFAAGDVIGGYRFTHVADHEARTVVRNALFPFASSVDYSVVPWAVYTDPVLARVGLTEKEAREQHGSGVAVYRYDLEALDRAIVDREARGLVKLITDAGGRVLGGHVLGPGAGTTIMEVATAMKGGLGIGDLSDLVHPYPTLSEGVRRAANEYYRSKLTDRVRRWLDRWFRLARALGL